MHQNITEGDSDGTVTNVSTWDGALIWTEEKTSNSIPCKVKLDEIILYIIIGLESLLLCVFIAATFYLYFNRTKDIEIDQVKSKVSNRVMEDRDHYLNNSEPQLMHYETVITASRRSSINSENPYEIIANNRSADARSLESNKNILSRSYENITEEDTCNQMGVPPSFIFDCKKLESVPVIIDGCTEVF